YLPQASRFDPHFPICVYDVVLSGLTCAAGSRSFCRKLTKEDKRKTDEVMERMGILHLKKRPIGELSGGQMQRVFLARALISAPRLLLLDEPNTFVDKGFEANFFEILEELNKEIAIVLVSHDLGMISSHVKSIACVNQGLYYHDSSEITQELLDNYGCPIDLITHGHLPHRVLKDHEHAYDACDRCRGEEKKND
ncbi:MAG: ATP-binding cassette domain-containing protein, partial [Candidatus Aminicenantes bacterium]|nr:ATP-binding cassette domain-containing protein [Candidatus Aminicenantes bacterium]